MAVRFILAGIAKLNLTSEFEYSLEYSHDHSVCVYECKLLLPPISEWPAIRIYRRMRQRCALLVSDSLVGMQIALSGIFAAA